MHNTRYSRQILTKLEFSRLMSEKYWNIKFTKTRPVGIDLLHTEGLDRTADTQA